jgi:predicted transposase YdaD
MQTTINKFPQLSFEEVLKMLDLKEVNLSETRFYQDVFQKGREQGLQREVELVLRLLERRCGLLGVDYLRAGFRQRQDLVRSLTITQLESLGDALLDFNKDGGSRGLVHGKPDNCNIGNL